MFERFRLLCRGDPAAPRRGDSVIVANWIPELARRGEVAVVHEASRATASPLRLASGLELPRRAVPPREVGPAAALLSLDPLPPRRVDARAFLAAVDELGEGAGSAGAGLTVAVGPELLPLAVLLAARGHPTCAVPYDSVPLLLHRRLALPGSVPRRLWDRLELLRWSRLYRRALSRLPVVVFVSDEDAADAAGRVPDGGGGRVLVAPNGVDAERFRPGEEDRDRPSVVFSGDLGAPQSREAVAVLREVMDVVWRERPEVAVLLAGRRPGPEALAWAAADTRVTATGEVPDLRPWIREAWVYVAPLVSGTGVKNRVLEALALGKPVVATPRAAAGLPGSPPLHPGSGPVELAGAVLQLLRDPGARASAGEASRAYAVRHLSWESQLRSVLEACEAAWGGRPAGGARTP